MIDGDHPHLSSRFTSILLWTISPGQYMEPSFSTPLQLGNRFGKAKQHPDCRSISILFIVCCDFVNTYPVPIATVLDADMRVIQSSAHLPCAEGLRTCSVSKSRSFTLASTSEKPGFSPFAFIRQTALGTHLGDGGKIKFQFSSGKTTVPCRGHPLPHLFLCHQLFWRTSSRRTKERGLIRLAPWPPPGCESYAQHSHR